MGICELLLPSGEVGQLSGENLDPRHFYAAYVFDQAETRKQDIVTLIEHARRLNYPVRYWWLSDAMELRGYPDRLIMCVHHPSAAEDAGMDLYETLKEHQASWDDLEAAAVDEYQYLGKPIEGPADIHWPDRTSLFPQAP